MPDHRTFPSPEYPEYREVIRFAWWPTRIDGRWRWWCDYVSEQVTSYDPYPTPWITVARTRLP